MPPQFEAPNLRRTERGRLGVCQLSANGNCRRRDDSAGPRGELRLAGAHVEVETVAADELLGAKRAVLIDGVPGGLGGDVTANPAPTEASQVDLLGDDRSAFGADEARRGIRALG